MVIEYVIQNSLDLHMIILQIPQFPRHAWWCPVKNHLVDIIVLEHAHPPANSGYSVHRSPLCGPTFPVCGAQVLIQLLNGLRPNSVLGFSTSPLALYNEEFVRLGGINAILEEVKI